MKTEEQKELWTEVTTKKTSFKFPQDQRVVLAITDWKLSKARVRPFGTSKDEYVADEDMEEKIEFSAQIYVSESGGVSQYPLRSLSVPLMQKLHVYLKDRPTTDVIFLSIKRLGSGNKTTYDVEPAMQFDLDEVL